MAPCQAEYVTGVKTGKTVYGLNMFTSYKQHDVVLDVVKKKGTIDVMSLKHRDTTFNEDVSHWALSPKPSYCMLLT